MAMRLATSEDQSLPHDELLRSQLMSATEARFDSLMDGFDAMDGKMKSVQDLLVAPLMNAAPASNS